MVLDYSDYREYLKVQYERVHQKNPKVSQRAYSLQLGFKSPTHFGLVVSGRQNLSPTSVELLSTHLRHTRREREYFRYLVLFCQAKEESERQRCLTELLKFRDSNVSRLHSDQYDYFAHWYIAAIREALELLPTRENWSELAAFLSPPITPAQAKEAVGTLDRLGLVEQDSTGRWRNRDVHLSTGPLITDMTVKLFQAEHLKLAIRSLQAFPRGEKNHSTLTFAIHPAGYDELLDELRIFRRRAMEITSRHGGQGRLYHLNMSLFPLSQRTAGGANAK